MMSPSRRAFLKSTLMGTSLAWGNLGPGGEPRSSTESATDEQQVAPLETRIPIPLSEIQGRRTNDGDLAVHPGESVRIKALVPGELSEFEWRLRLVGSVDVDPRLRTEEGFPTFYRLIDDALDSGSTHHQTYSLALHSRGELYPRRAYFRALWNPKAEETEYPLKVWVRKEGVETLLGGRVGIEVAIYLVHPGRNRGDISELPDDVSFLDVGQGTRDWQARDLAVRLKGDIACLLFTVVGENFRGRIWLEDPQFPGPDGMNCLPPFAPSRPGAPHRNWLGENLSQKEWPEFRMSINGQELFHGELFQPIYSWPAAEVDVPAGLLRTGENDLTIQLASNYHEALAYILRRLEFLKTPNGGLEVLACPKLVMAENEFSMLIKTRHAGLEASVNVLPAPGAEQAAIKPILTELEFPAAGLHFVRFRAAHAGPGGTVRFRYGGQERQVIVERVVDRNADGVLVGSGDSLYVAAEAESLRRYHTWYLHHGLGNCIVYRPIYRWGGTQVRDVKAWQEAARFCERAGLKYSLILDGREIPGTDGNPTDEMLAGPLYLGSQMHEHDGIFNYWGISWRWPEEELFDDVYERFPAHGRDGLISDPQVRGAGPMTPLYYDPHRAHDMRDGAEYFVENLHRELHLAGRHSGPSTLFKYFFQAGFKWLAAETMYGPHEIILGALRGASLANGQPDYGVHIAAEWSTTPHDDPAAFRRYFLALATPYVHGSQHIYIEDGLWHMEEGLSADDRFSPACQGHLRVHQDFYRFTRAHTRRGRMRVPMGFLHGRFDGWTCWTRAKVWGQEGPDWDFAEPEKSWDLLKVFFPRSVLAPIYLEPCPHQSVGFFTGTPYGPADIVPIEADQKTLSKYTTLVFLGWNTSDEDQVERLRGYVEAGGHLILALPHLSTETRRKQLPHLLIGSGGQQLLGAAIRGLKRSSGNCRGRQLADQSLSAKLGTDELLLGDVDLGDSVHRLTDMAGTPVLAERKLGAGQVTIVNVAAYPGNASLERLYHELLRETGHRILQEERARVWVRGSDDTSFAVYDWDEAAGKPATSTIYLLNVDWWSDPPLSSQADLLWQDVEIPLSITRGKIHIVTVSGDWGLWTQDIDTDVTGLYPGRRDVRVSLQGQGNIMLQVLYRPAARDGDRPQLACRSRHGPLAVEMGPVPGLWKTELFLYGPEQLEFTIDK
jgi:hypothetical protein